MQARWLSLFLILFTFRTTQAANSGPELRIRLENEPISIDWQMDSHLFISTNLMEGLVALDEQLKPVPRLATKWTLAKDRKTYIFELRNDVRWSDGAPLTAADFVYAWKRLLAPATASPNAYYLFDIAGANEFNKGKLTDFGKVGVRALDAQHLEVRLAKPIAFWPTVLSFMATYPLREGIVEKSGNDWATPGKIVTLGPFLLESVQHESKIVLKRNPAYVGAKGNVERVTFLIINQGRTALNLFEAGKLDMVHRLGVEDVRNQPHLHRFPVISSYVLQFNVGDSLMQNKALRSAIAKSIDKSKFPSIVPDATAAADAWAPPEIFNPSEKVGLSFDPEGARRELAAAGLDPQALPRLSFVITQTEHAEKIATFIQEELRKNLGLKIEIKVFDLKTTVQMRRERKYQLRFFDWSADLPDASNFLLCLTKDSGMNQTGWSNESYDQLVNTAMSERNEKKRLAQYVAAHKMLEREDPVVVPLFYGSQIAVLSRRAEGVRITPFLNLPLKDVIIPAQ